MSRRLLTYLDWILFSLLTLFLLGIVVTSGMANIQTDAIDYYAIVQRLTGDEPPIVPHLPFVEQRSPGYPLLTLPLYYLLGVAPEGELVRPDELTSGRGSEMTDARLPTAVESSESVLLPPAPLLLNDIFFLNVDLAPQGGVLRWRIIAAMLLTGYALFFGGLALTTRSLQTMYAPPLGVALLPLMVFTAPIFMHNLVMTPAYATLTAFGVSAIFTWFWLRGWQTAAPGAQIMAGMMVGWLVLVRLELVLVAAALSGMLLLWREWRYLRHFILGGLLPLAVWLAYNTAQFGNPLHAGILRGNMNLLAFDAAYVWATLAAPQSGILFSSLLIVVGLTGLWWGQRPLHALAAASFLVILLIALRVPIMYYCVGQGTQIVSGTAIACPIDNASMLSLIRSDANRYLIPLAPFAILGLRQMIDWLAGRLTKPLPIQSTN